MNHEADIHLVIVERDARKAKSHAGTLHAAGYPVQFEHAADLDALAKVLDGAHPDMLLCGTGRGLPDPAAVEALLLERGTEILLIACNPDTPENGVTATFLTGGTTPPCRDAFDNLQTAFIKVFPFVLLQRRFRKLQSILDESENLRRQDNLTGLCNRQYFMQVVEERIRNGIEAGRPEAVIYVLLDNMKSVREESGPTGHDTVIGEIAALISDSCTAEDTIARFSDYAFTILHRGDMEDVRGLAETLRARIGGHVTDAGDHTALTTCSIGICQLNEHTADARTALSRADLACEVARSAGGDQLHIHSTAVDERMDSAHEAEWDEIINKTIEDERFYLVYQPIISMKGDPAQRYEVLLRILDEKGQVILPGQFVSIADRIGLGSTIDRRVIDHAFRAMREAQGHESNVEFFIKLTGTTLKDRDLPAWINRKLKENRLQNERIVFEIPETVAVRDLGSTMLFVKAMQKLHCRVALEHFGSVNQPQLVRHLCADLLKIDGSLISNLASSKEHQEAVKVVVTLAHDNGIQCIAERVDSAADLSMLWACGVDYIQGNFVQEPCRELNFDFAGEIA